MKSLARFSVAAALALGSAPLVGQTWAVYSVNSTERSWARDAGPVGCELGLEADYRVCTGGTSPSRATTAGARVFADLEVYSYSATVGEVSADFSAAASGTASWSVQARLFGLLLYSRSDSFSGSLSKTFTKSAELEVPVYSGTWLVGPVPVSLTFNVGSEVDLNLSAGFVPLSLALTASGGLEVIPLRCELDVGVGVAAGFIGAMAGVSGELSFGRSGIDITALLTPSVFGINLDYYVAAVTLELAIEASAWLGPLKCSWEKVLFEQSWGVASGRITL